MPARWYAHRGTQALTRQGLLVDVVEVDTTNPLRTYLVRPVGPCITAWETMTWLPVYDIAHEVAGHAHHASKNTVVIPS